MSNIQTSYIRIYRRDGQAISETEAEHLLHLAARAYREFGSYWVRILKKYRSEEKCLDIQFGSGKRYHSGNLLEEYEIYNHYIVWERFADEGGFKDSIFTLEEDTQNKWIVETTMEPCLYRFNKVVVKSPELPAYFKQFDFAPTSSGAYELNMQGSYYACNSRSFMDVNEDSPFYGPKLGYDPSYESDYFIPTKDGGITQSDSPLLKDIFIHPHQALQGSIRVELHWENRMVQAVEKKESEVECFAADYWDNCCDQDYLTSVQQKDSVG